MNARTANDLTWVALLLGLLAFAGCASEVAGRRLSCSVLSGRASAPPHPASPTHETPEKQP